jgi:hypothetical protein
MAINFPEGWQDYPSRFANIAYKYNPTQYTISVNHTSWTNATNCAVSIAPRSTSSQILLMVAVNGVSPNTTMYRVVRNGTVVGGGTSGTGSMSNVWAGSFYRNSDMNHGHTHTNFYVDSPSTTSAVTYQVQLQADTNSTFYLNHNNNGSNAPIAYHAQSYLVAIELEAV